MFNALSNPAFPTLPVLESPDAWSRLQERGLLYVQDQPAKLTLSGRGNHRTLCVVLFRGTNTYLSCHQVFRIELQEGYIQDRTFSALMGSVHFSLQELVHQLTEMSFGEDRFGISVGQLGPFKVTARYESDSTIVNPFGWASC